MIDLLQVAADTANQIASNAAITVSQADKNGDGNISLGELLSMGGWLMYPLLGLLLLAIFFFFERLIAIRKAGRLDQNFMNIIRDHIVSGNVTAARSFAKNTDNPVEGSLIKASSVSVNQSI